MFFSFYLTLYWKRKMWIPTLIISLHLFLFHHAISQLSYLLLNLEHFAQSFAFYLSLDYTSKLILNDACLIYILFSVSWFSVFITFWWIFAEVLQVSKAFFQVWHNAVTSKFISDFLSFRTVETVADNHCLSFKSIHSGICQGSALFYFFVFYFTTNLL